MAGPFNVGNYLPDRPPTWADVVIVVSGSISIGFSLQSFQPKSLSAVALGFVGVGILLGPVAQTRVGKQIDKWGTEIGPRGRTTVITVFVTAVIVASSFEVTPTTLIGDIGLGMVMFGVLVLALHILHERRIEGLLPKTS